MARIITIAVAAGLVLTAAIVGFWTTLPAGSALQAGAIDPHALTLKTKKLPAQEITDLY